MNIMENKRVAAIAFVMALAFGGVCYYGYDRYEALKEYQSKIEDVSAQMAIYEDESIPPREANREEITKAAKSAKELHDKLQKTLLMYASFCTAGQGAQDASALQGYVAPVPKGVHKYEYLTNPAAFQTAFKAMIASLSSLAEEKGCTLGSSSQSGSDLSVAKFGNYSRYELDMPTGENTPYINFLAHAADEALSHIIEAGAPTIKKIYFRELPDAAERKAPIVRLGMEIAFTAKRSEWVKAGDPDSVSVLPQVINRLTHDPHFFFIPTGISVTPSVKNLPEPDINTLIDPDVAADDDDEEDVSPSERSEKLAAPHLGKPDETVDVYLTLQVLFFTSDKF